MINDANYEKNPKLGFYKVGSQVFYSKPLAYVEATKQGIDPSWHFNSSTYARLNWEQEPELDIRELYRLRAVQLREKYDWIRLECSGGGDSTTAAFAFLLNGIHLDEIVFRYPKHGEKGATNDPFNTKATNTLSEWQFAAQPLLDWVKTKFPKTIVRVHDYSETMIEEEKTKDESWVFNTQHWFQPGHASKYTHFGLKEHRDLADSGKSICVLLGIDKPKVTIVDDNWYAFFLDIQATSANPINNGYTNITTEYFYWTPDFTEIVIKQSHMIRRWFDMPQNQHLHHLVRWPNTDVNARTAYEFLAKSIVYPDYDLATWQTDKPTNSFYNEMDHWFYKNFQDTEMYRTWEAGLDFLVDKINPKYFLNILGKPTGIKANTSPLYYIGPVAGKFPKDSVPNWTTKTPETRQVIIIKDKKMKIIHT
ncbi:hypothetical protein UFOVP112_434 [uncultured Caudovirales phage]|uniref:Uncharacterized protein n=1 Tax=uncultured Caudovirales phage TaxID=2100421 RepID=A0A6J5L7Z0_9CAUD|nr:hypothetical protein UFOVP112_434 [uncultured Caudovirales phage]